MYRSITSQRGQAMVEYALILVLVATFLIIVLVSMGEQLSAEFSNVSCAIAHAHHGMGGCETGRPD